VRDSSILPMREQAGNTTSDHGELLEIHLYNGTRTNSFLLYEDDGITLDHEKGIFSKRVLEFLPNENKFRINSKEGTYESPFKIIRLHFHGFNIQSAQVNGNTLSVNQKQYRFVQPISNFDPVNTMPEGPKISSLSFIDIPYDSNTLEVRW
jgi:alpha-glucosidase